MAEEGAENPLKGQESEILNSQSLIAELANIDDLRRQVLERGDLQFEGIMSRVEGWASRQPVEWSFLREGKKSDSKLAADYESPLHEYETQENGKTVILKVKQIPIFRTEGPREEELTVFMSFVDETGVEAAAGAAKFLYVPHYPDLDRAVSYDPPFRRPLRTGGYAEMEISPDSYGFLEKNTGRIRLLNRTTAPQDIIRNGERVGQVVPPVETLNETERIISLLEKSTLVGKIDEKTGKIEPITSAPLPSATSSSI